MRIGVQIVVDFAVYITTLMNLAKFLGRPPANCFNLIDYHDPKIDLLILVHS